MKKVMGLLVGLAIALGITSCGDDVTKWNTIKEEYQLPVITLKIGDTVQETEWNKAAKKNICKVDVTEKEVVNVSVTASKIVDEKSIDITEEIKDSLQWYVGQTQVDAEKNGLTSFDFDTANKNKGSYTFYCSYTAKDAEGKDWTYTSRAVEFKLLKPGINLELSDDELEFGEKFGTTEVKTTLKVTPYEFEPTTYQVVKIIGNDEADENIDVTDKDLLENEGVEVTFNKAGTHRIKVIANDGTKSATEEIEVHVKEITIENVDVDASFTVDKTTMYEGTAKPVATVSAKENITYSDGDTGSNNLVVTKFMIKVGTGEEEEITGSTNEIPLTAAGKYSVSVSKVFAKHVDADGNPTGDEEAYVCETDPVEITFVGKTSKAPTYKASFTLSATSVKETVDSKFNVTPTLEMTQEYTDGTTNHDETVPVTEKITGIVVKAGDTLLTANEDGSYKVADLTSGENTISVTVSSGDLTITQPEAQTITYATIAKAATEYVATITKSAATKGDTVDLAAICKLTQTLHWTDGSVKTDDVTPTAAKWYKGATAEAVTTEITSIDTSAAAEIYVKVVLTYDGKDTPSEAVKFTISDAPSSWTAGQDIPSWLIIAGTAASNNRAAFSTENGGNFAQAIATSAAGSFKIKPISAGTVKIYIAANDGSDTKGGTVTAKVGETTIGTYAMKGRDTASATHWDLVISEENVGKEVTITTTYKYLLFKIDIQ